MARNHLPKATALASLTVLALVVATSAEAQQQQSAGQQQQQAPPQQAPPQQAPQQQNSPTQTVAVTTSTDSDQDNDEDNGDEPGAAVDGPRLRLGVEGGAGGEWGTPRGLSIGLYGQIGLQLNNMFAIYYQPSLSVHALSRDLGGEDEDVFAAWGNLAFADVTFGALQVGLGAGIDYGRFASCDQDGCDRGDRRRHPAIGGRLAGVLETRSPTDSGRMGIPFALNIHSTFFDGDSRVTSVILTVGLQRF